MDEKTRAHAGRALVKSSRGHNSAAPTRRANSIQCLPSRSCFYERGAQRGRGFFVIKFVSAGLCSCAEAGARLVAPGAWACFFAAEVSSDCRLCSFFRTLGTDGVGAGAMGAIVVGAGGLATATAGPGGGHGRQNCGSGGGCGTTGTEATGAGVAENTAGMDCVAGSLEPGPRLSLPGRLAGHAIRCAGCFEPVERNWLVSTRLAPSRKALERRLCLQRWQSRSMPCSDSRRAHY